VVIRGGAKGDIHAIVERIMRAGESQHARVRQVEKPKGRKLQVLFSTRERALSWWSEGDDLVMSLVSPGGPDAIIAALDGREPSAIEHPGRIALLRSRDVRGFQPAGLAFFDMAALPPLPKEVVALGLDRIKRFDYRFGFRDQALESALGVVVPAPRKGIPALFDQPAFDARHLPALPARLAGFTVLSLDFARLWDQLISDMEAIERGGARPLIELEKTTQKAVGLRLRDDVLANLGPRITYYTVPAKVNAPTNFLEGIAQGFFLVPKTAIVVEIKNHDAVAKALEMFIPHANRALQGIAGKPGGPDVGQFQRPTGQEERYVVFAPGPALPLPAGMRPTVLLGRKTLVLATSPATARQAALLNERSRTSGLPAGDPLGRALEGLPETMTFLNVQDTRRSLLPEVLASLPGLVEFAITNRDELPLGLGFPFPEVPLPPFVTPGTAPPPPKRPPAIDPDLIPDPEELRPFLFPGVNLLTVDPEGVRFISREAFPTINPANVVPVALALLVPAVHAAQVGAGRSQSVNNLKRIGLALHNFHDVNTHFPADLRSKDGKLLLSWRVQLLPFLDEQELFNEFRLNEPWDSPHNKDLLQRMPAVFAVPGSPDESDKTFYRAFSGKGTVFDPAAPGGVGIERITDGTSNTIAVVEAKEAVPWTKPGSDLPFESDPKAERIRALRSKLGGHFTGGFSALFWDGSVHFIRDSTNPITLQALITRDGGEVVSSDSF
jgi:hypothetical protein